LFFIETINLSVGLKLKTLHFYLRPYVIWKYALPHRLLFLEWHISYPDCRSTDIKAEMNVYYTSGLKEGQFTGFICTVLHRHIGNRINHWPCYKILQNSTSTWKFRINREIPWLGLKLHGPRKSVGPTYYVGHN